MSEPDIFSASEQLGRNFPTVQNCLVKWKNLYLINLVSRWKRTIGKEHTSFLVFHFWNLKFVSINSALILHQVTSPIFFKNVDVVPEKQPNLKIQDKIFLKCSLWPIAAKLENCWNQYFLQEVDQESCGRNRIYQSLILTQIMQK